MTKNSIDVVLSEYRTHKYFYISTSKLELDDYWIDLYVEDPD